MSFNGQFFHQIKGTAIDTPMSVSSFNGQFFHQIKGTAIDTPMSVSYANIFLSEFEQCLLQDYEQRYKHKPALWLIFKDDIFSVWIGDEASF